MMWIQLEDWAKNTVKQEKACFVETFVYFVETFVHFMKISVAGKKRGAR